MDTVGRGLDTATFLMRRLGIVVVAAVVAWSAVKATVEYVGGDESVEAAETLVVGGAGETVGDGVVESAASVADGASDVGDDPAPEPEVVATDPPETTTTAPAPTTTLPDRQGPPTSENPARVYIVGDSDAGTFGPYLKTLLDGTQITTSELNYVVSSGLSRPDFFDWPTELQAALPAVNPDVVVVTFGGNDAQGLALPEGEFIVGQPTDGNRDEWIAEYASRAGMIMDLLLENGRKVVWVGIPNDDNPEVTARMAIQDEAARLAASTRDVVFVDTWKRFSGRDGGWAEFVIDPRDGVGKDVRAADGFHLNTTGAEILAIDIAQAVAGELRELGANI